MIDEWMVARSRKPEGGTSPSKVYANIERTADFLLCRASIEVDTQVSKVRLELFRRLEDDSGHAKVLSRFRIGGYIVYVDGFLGAHLAGPKGFPIDERIGLAGADTEGIDAYRKEAEEREMRLSMGHVEGVGIGKQGETVVPGQLV